ncbi:MAG TPA: DUF4136 domain-containing protein [Candidatus Acidoferrum sp.]|jgi:hypothetical protein
MKMPKVMFVRITMMLLFAAKTPAQQVKTDYDCGAHFAQYKTYSWDHVRTKDALDVDRIKSAVNAALTARGWTQVESGGDVSIVAMEITRNQQTLHTFYDGFGGGWGWRRFGAGGFGTFRRNRRANSMCLTVASNLSNAAQKHPTQFAD